MKRRLVETRTIRMNVVEQGSGHALLFCHGFPETSHSWRHQVEALARGRHWLPQERPDRVSAAIVEFARGVLSGV